MHEVPLEKGAIIVRFGQFSQGVAHGQSGCFAPGRAGGMIASRSYALS
jgi:hypothetical protein